MENFSKYEFSGINFKRKTAIRFRSFSKEISKSNTDTMSAMLDFFEIHELSPLDSIDGSLSAVEIRIKRRISNAIAIINDMEKDHKKSVGQNPFRFSNIPKKCPYVPFSKDFSTYYLGVFRVWLSFVYSKK